MSDTQPAGTPAADRHAPRPHSRTATCMICELPIVYSGQGRWLHEADGWDDFDPPHSAAPADTPEPSTPPAQPPGGSEREHVVANAIAFEVYGADGRPSSPAGDTLAIRVTDEERATAYRAAGRVLSHLAEFDAERDGASRAAAGGHPGTPDGPGVLGRALLDSRGNVWNEELRAVPLDQNLGPVREVLLVDPELMDLLRQWRDGYVDGDGLEYTEARRALAAAVDAYDRPTTGADEHEEAFLAAIAEPAPADEAAMDADMAEFAGLPDCQHCDGTGKAVPEGWYERRRETERRAAQALAPAVERYLRRAEPAPEPAGDGPGFHQQDIAYAVARLTNAGHPGLAAAVIKLLADRDRWAKVSGKWADETIAARNAADAARAELAEVTAERDRLERLTAADRETMARMRAELATARRDAAADALDYGAGWIRRVFADGIDPEVAKCLDALAVTTRTGTRPVPGSPQPGADGGEEIGNAE